MSTIDALAKYALVFIAGVIFFAILHFAKNVVMPIVAAFIFALIIGPIGDRLSRIGISPVVTNLIIVLNLIAIFVLLAIFVIPRISQSLASLPAYIEDISERMNGIMAQLNTFSMKIRGEIKAGAETKETLDLAKILSGFTVYLAAALSPALSNLVIFIVSLVMIMIDRHLIKTSIVKIFTTRSQRLDALRTLNRIEKRLSEYLLVVAAINGSLAVGLAAAYSILGIPGAIIISFFAFLLNFLPFVGPLLLKITLVAFGYVTYGFTLLMLAPVAVYTLAILIESNFVTPVLVGRKFTLRPILVFGSVVLWTWLWGLVGALLAMPILVIAAIVYDALTSDDKIKLPS